MSIRGSCLCGGVRYEIDRPLGTAANCHCAMCRKQHGAAFRSRLGVEASRFHWIEGEEMVTFYESTPGTHRGFCRVCGSPVANRIAATAVSGGGVARMGIHLGGLDDDPGVAPAMHVFVANKAPWFIITDDLPQFAQFPTSSPA